MLINTSSRSLLNALCSMVRNSFGEGYEVNAIGGDYPCITIRQDGNTEYRIKLNGLGSGSLADLGAKVMRAYLDRPKTLMTKDVLGRVRYFIPDQGSDELEGKPSVPFLDLQMGYVVAFGENKNLDIVVTNEMCEMLNIEKEFLDLATRRNVIGAGFETLPYSSIAPIQVECEDEWMFILQTRARQFGASVLLFDEPFADLTRKVLDDLYVFPSSKHEVIAIPARKFDDTVDIDALKHMVDEINASGVEKEDQLGRNVYKYDLYRQEFSIM